MTKTQAGCALAALLGIAAALPAVAAEDRPAPRTIDMTTKLVDTDGKPLHDAFDPVHDEKDDPKCLKCRDATVEHMVETVLLMNPDAPDPRALADDEARVRWGLQKAARARLAETIAKTPGAVVLTIDQTSLIARLIAESGFSGNVIAQAYPIFDPNKQFPEAK